MLIRHSRTRVVVNGVVLRRRGGAGAGVDVGFGSTVAGAGAGAHMVTGAGTRAGRRVGAGVPGCGFRQLHMRGPSFGMVSHSVEGS